VNVVRVDELQRAWAAAQAGHFRTPADRGVRGALPCLTECDVRSPALRWDPDGLVLPVLGAHGSAGSTTVAVALATATGGPARVVEACPATATGLAACATAELGTSGDGWARGSRGDVVLEHRSELVVCPQDLPLPRHWAALAGVTVLDVAAEPGQLFASGAWLAAAVREARGVVVVTTATVPGLRRLQSTLHLLGLTGDEGDLGRHVVAVLGPPRRRWPREVAHSLGTLTAGLEAAGHLIPVPHDPTLAVRGLDGTDLPAGVLAAATQILRIAQPEALTNHSEGTRP